MGYNGPHVSSFIYGIRTLLIFVASFGVFGISMPQASTLPSAIFTLQYNSIPGAKDAVSDTPVSSSFSFFGGTLDVGASASTTAFPAASVTLDARGCTSGFPGSGCAGGVYDVIAKIQYYILVSGPNDQVAPYFFQSAGAVESFEFENNPNQIVFPRGYASVKLLGAGGFDASTDFRTDGTTHCGTTCINATNQALLRTNTPYLVEIYVWAMAFTNFKGSASVWADPYIYIDPTFVGGDQFSLLISDGIGNSPLVSAVPLPSALPLFAAGLGLLGWASQRRTEKRNVRH